MIRFPVRYYSGFSFKYKWFLKGIRKIFATPPRIPSQLLPLERGSGYLSVAVEFLRVKLSRKYLDLSLHFVLAALFYNPVAPDVGRG